MSSIRLRSRTSDGLRALKPYLDEINDAVERPDYVASDPVQFMHAFTDKKDIEIAGFLAATMAWGRRDIVNQKVEELLSRIDFDPYRFVRSYDGSEFSRFRGFRHRTFKPIDMHGLMLALGEVYRQHEDFEAFWRLCRNEARDRSRPLFSVFRERFFGLNSDLAVRTRKHVSDPENGSPAKRLCMFLRWACRRPSPVDPGIWSLFKPSELWIPLDVHVSRQSRIFGLLTRKSNDWKAVQELTETMRRLNPEDPSRYDYALFGLGALDYELPRRFILNKI
jgi:uncharacterized protein (TIGR02757 family)